MGTAISGSFGVGKSTITKAIYSHLKNEHPEKRVFMIGDISRDLVLSGRVLHDRRSTLEHYFLYVAEYVRRLIPLEYDILIQDRTLLDTLSYIVINGNAPPEFIEMMEVLVKWYIMGIDSYFYIPIEFSIVEDGIRTIDSKYQQDIDAQIKHYLHQFNVPYRVLSGNISYRLEQALRWISSTE
jgi:thymidylate kinase